MLIIRRALQSMLTVAILGLLIYYLISGAPTIIGTTPSESVAIADNYVVQARSWQYEASGQRSHVLVMSDLQHFDSTGVSLVTQPLLEVYSEGQPAWTVSAENGRIIDQADHIELRDNVELSSLTSSLALATDAMDIYPSQKMAKSEQLVQISDGLSSMDAGGMEADLQRNQITMKHGVKGQYFAP